MQIDTRNRDVGRYRTIERDSAFQCPEGHVVANAAVLPHSSRVAHAVWRAQLAHRVRVSWRWTRGWT